MMNNDYILNRLKELADEEYRLFHSKLLPDYNGKILGVRVPKLRSFAKSLAKDDWQKLFLEIRDDCYEQTLLKGFMISYAKTDLDTLLFYVEKFVPLIDNWATCDMFCCSLKKVKYNLEQVFLFLQKYLNSNKPFEIRFGVVMLLDYFITDEYIDEVLVLLQKIKNDDYYVKMAVAWAVSVCYVKHPDKTYDFLRKCNLDTFTFNKSLQKICESYRITKEQKVIIKLLKRN